MLSGASVETSSLAKLGLKRAERILSHLVSNDGSFVLRAMILSYENTKPVTLAHTPAVFTFELLSVNHLLRNQD